MRFKHLISTYSS